MALSYFLKSHPKYMLERRKGEFRGGDVAALSVKYQSRESRGAFRNVEVVI